MTEIFRTIRSSVVDVLTPALTQQNVQNILQGVSGNGIGDANYIHHELTPNTTWVIKHNLKKYPSVTVMDSAGSKFIVDVLYVDTNTVEVHMTYPMSGTATLN